MLTETAFLSSSGVTKADRLITSLCGAPYLFKRNLENHGCVPVAARLILEDGITPLLTHYVGDEESGAHRFIELEVADVFPNIAILEVESPRGKIYVQRTDPPIPEEEHSLLGVWKKPFIRQNIWFKQVQVNESEAELPSNHQLLITANQLLEYQQGAK